MKVQRANSANRSALDNAVAVSSRGSGGKNAGRDDQVQMSTLSSALTAIEVQWGNRTAKVVDLSGAIASDGYQVDVHSLSASLIREHLGAIA